MNRIFLKSRGRVILPAKKPWSGGWRAGWQRGQAMTEFAFSIPLILGVLLAITAFGVAFNNQLVLTNATTAGAQQLSISRGQTSDPCATTSSTVIAAAPNLASGSLSFSIAFGTGNPVTYGSPYTGTSCTAAAASLVSGNTAKVTVTYPCNVSVPVILENLSGWSPPSCTLSAQTAELIQ
jgi:Flp pilus assembly protein TadG